MKKRTGVASEMNRWPYQSVLCLVFNLETEREKRSTKGAQDEEREKNTHTHTEMYNSHGGRNLTVEPLASPTVAHSLMYFGVLHVMQKFPWLKDIHIKKLMFNLNEHKSTLT